MTQDKLTDVWAARDFPILKVATRLVDEGGSPSVEEIALESGLTPEDVRRGINALHRRGFVRVEQTLAGTGWIIDVSGEAYLLTGLHPDGDEALLSLADLFRQAAERTTDPDDKTRLRRAAAAIGDLVGQVGSGVLTAFIAHQGGFGG